MAISINSIRRVSNERPPIVVVYGGPGIGKTTFAACAPDVVFVRVEDGLGNLTANAFEIAKTFGEVIEQLEAIRDQQHGYRWLALDSLSALEPLIWDAVCVADGKKSIEDFGFGKGYVQAGNEWRKFFDLLGQIVAKGIGCILIAHSEVVRFESPEVPAYDRAQIKLHKRAFGLVYERADVIGYAAPQVNVITEKNGEQSRGRGINTGERLLHLTEKPAFVAKNRFSFPSFLPLAWPAFYAALQAAVAPPAPAPTTQPN